LSQRRLAYVQARPGQKNQLDAARYAANRSIHQIIGVTLPYGVMNFPLNIKDIFDTYAGIRWLPAGHLPPTYFRDCTP
jgi:hypothetical protein